MKENKNPFIPSSFKKEQASQPKTKEDVMSLYSEIENSFMEVSGSVTPLTPMEYREDVERVSRNIQKITDKIHQGFEENEVTKLYKNLEEMKEKLSILSTILKWDSNRHHI